RQFVGQIEAATQATLAFELGGTLVQLAVTEGEEVQEGQVIARLDTDLLLAEDDRLTASRAALSAQLEFAESRLKRAERLREEGFASDEAVEQAVATRDELQNGIREIDAALRSVTINLKKSVLRAPFDGRVGAQMADQGEIVSAGTPLVGLIAETGPEVRIGLPLSLDIDALGLVEIVVDGTPYAARLVQMRPDIDPVTRTRTAIFALDTDRSLAFGQTATLRVDTTIAAPGAWVPLDALQEGAGGLWTILVAGDDAVVRSAVVEVLHAAETQAFVRGTFPQGTRMIATGAHRVVPGQQVRILDAQG
ncbi:MAG: efflux RND transporter periplasmic adaptor subunit, partial [Pseudomonadota bacterium]